MARIESAERSLDRVVTQEAEWPKVQPGGDVMRGIRFILVALVVVMVLAGCAQSAVAKTSIVGYVPPDPPTSLPGFDGKLIPIAKMPVVIQGAGSFWPCFAMSPWRFRVLSHDSVAFVVSALGIYGAGWDRFSFANYACRPWDPPNAESYEADSPSLVRKSSWFDRSDGALDDVDLAVDGIGLTVLPAQVPEAWYTPLYMNVHCAIDPPFDGNTDVFIDDRWWYQATVPVEQHDLPYEAMAMFDAVDPQVKLGKLTRSGKTIQLPVTLSDWGSPWARVKIEIDRPGISASVMYGILNDDFATPRVFRCSNSHTFKLPEIPERGVYPTGRYKMEWSAEDVAGNVAEGTVYSTLK